MAKKQKSISTNQSHSNEEVALHLNKLTKDNVKFVKMLKVEKELKNMSEAYEYIVEFYKANA